MSFDSYTPMDAESFSEAAKARQWADALLFGTQPPETTTQPVELPDGVFVCMSCGKINTYWDVWCEECDMNKNAHGGDGPDD